MRSVKVLITSLFVVSSFACASAKAIESDRFVPAGFLPATTQTSTLTVEAKINGPDTVNLRDDWEIKDSHREFQSFCWYITSLACPPVNVQEYILEIFTKDEINTAADLQAEYNQHPLDSPWGYGWRLEKAKRADELTLRTVGGQEEWSFDVSWNVRLLKHKHDDGKRYGMIAYKLSAITPVREQ